MKTTINEIEAHYDKINADYEQIPDFVYHATLKDLLPSIAKYGLGKSIKHKDNSIYEDFYQGDGVFFSFDYKDAFDYVFDDEIDIEDVVVIEIPKKILDKNKIFYDINNEDNIEHPTTWYYKGVIDNPTKNTVLVDL